MSHAFKFCIFAISAVLGMADQALAQCFVCSDSNANTASGTYTLGSNSGADNTATGFVALGGNTSGSRNNASGGYALFSNTTASDNNAMGYVAMYSNTIGTLNNAVGSFSLYANTSGSNNSAVGYAALYKNTTGSNNNAQGFYALQNNTTGSNNTAIGQYSGNNLTTGNNNIDIGNYGIAGESGVIRIGSSATQTTAYMAGIHNSPITGAAVYVSSSGQLGVLASSERYKTAITSMGAATEKLQRLRPVTFHLKSEPDGALQYGLIAEEVAKVYPELVIRDETGKIQGVRYDELAPMLLNDVQQLQLKVQYQQQKLTEVEQLEQQVAELKQQNESMQAVLAKLLTKDQRVAMQ
jgi:hypothetical protein